MLDDHGVQKARAAGGSLVAGKKIQWGRGNGGQWACTSDLDGDIRPAGCAAM